MTRRRSTRVLLDQSFLASLRALQRLYEISARREPDVGGEAHEPVPSSGIVVYPGTAGTLMVSRWLNCPRGLRDQVLTLVDAEMYEGVGGTTHFMRTLEATYCGLALAGELRSTARDVTAGALDDAGTEVCFACQTRWFGRHGDAAAGEYAAQNPDLDIPTDVDPPTFLAGYLKGLDER